MTLGEASKYVYSYMSTPDRWTQLTQLGGADTGDKHMDAMRGAHTLLRSY